MREGILVLPSRLPIRERSASSVSGGSHEWRRINAWLQTTRRRITREGTTEKEWPALGEFACGEAEEGHHDVVARRWGP